MPLSQARIYKETTKNTLFSLQIDQSKEATDILMKLFIPEVLTNYFPHTYLILKKHLPSIFKSKCFNKNNHPFDIEVRNTEIGHLFEHVLLEYLSQQKELESGRHIYNGLTSWNWFLEKRGVFHINIDIGYKDEFIFYLALQKSIKLINNILYKSI